jgi:pyridoxine 4-dehydrogenase
MTTNTATLTRSSVGTITVGGELAVNRLGFGAMRVTGQGIYGEPPDREEAKRLLRRAYELGATFFDTADSYGPHVSELLIAEALHPYPEDLVIATKGGLQRPGPGEWTPDGRPEHLRGVCEGSLQRLRLEQIPLYQLHRPDPNVPLAESVGALVQLRDEGKVRHIGLCNVTPEQLAEAQKITPIASVQNRYNVTDRRFEAVVETCERRQIAFLPWAPVKDLDQADVISHLARRHGVTPHQIVLAWLLARSPVMLPIPGTSSMAHLEENMAAAEVQLTPYEVAAITNAA